MKYSVRMVTMLWYDRVATTNTLFLLDNSFHAPSECDESRKATDDNQLFVCSICSKQYTQKSNVLRHMLHTHVIHKSMECSKCAQSHQSMAALRDHLSRHISRISNTSVAANVCPVCNRKFRRKCNFDRHLNTHTGESLICDVCMKKFTSPETLASHKRLHAEELRCMTCSKIFKSRYCYKAHMLIHRVSAASVQFECHRCKKVYLTLHQLKRHIRNHNRMVRGDCSICGHAFYNASDQKAHQRKHTGELPFECEYCHRRFRVKDNLKSHLIQHTGDRPFGCSLCGKCYARKSKLTQHIDTVHKKLKSFGCEICEKRFPTQSHLKQHVRSHSSVRPFQCTQCGVQFKKKSDLKVHLNRKHQLEGD